MNKTILPWTDTEPVQEALLAFIASCPVLTGDTALSAADALLAASDAELYVQGADGLELTFESLPENDVGVCLSTRQAAFYDARYIMGGYRAQYQFNIIYRAIPMDGGEIINATDLLNRTAAWCEQNVGSLEIPFATVRSLVRTSNAAVLAVYEDGTKDYNISMTLIWEVI